MLTELKEEQIIALGAKHKADQLLKQYFYTFDLVKYEGEPLLDLLPDGYLEELARAAERVRTSLTEEFRSQEEGEVTQQIRDDILNRAAAWQGKALAHSLGNSVDAPDQDEARQAPGRKDILWMTTRTEHALRRLEMEDPNPHGKRMAALIHEGRSLLQCLKALDPAREMKRLRCLPDSVRAFYYEKGLLYAGLWIVTDACREIHAGNEPARAKYNLSILEARMEEGDGQPL